VIVDEGVRQLDDHLAGDPGMGVAPAVGVEAADIVAPEVGGAGGGGVVDDEELAVVPPALPGGDVGETAEQRMPLDVDAGRQGAEEGPRHDEVGELVEGDEDLDPALVGPHEGVAEGQAGPVALPDVRLEEDPGLGGLDVGEHVLEEGLAGGVDPQVAAGDGQVARLGPREPDHGPVLLAQGVEDEQPRHGRGLGGQRDPRRPARGATGREAA
jgi:hypothetical protein